eukprot:359761-Chlamydomonas_euryale.AAC.1
MIVIWWAEVRCVRKSQCHAGTRRNRSRNGRNSIVCAWACACACARASKYGFLIYAAKTEIMVVGQPMTLPTFKLSGKELLVTASFQYLGSFFVDDGSTRRVMDVRNIRALAAFRQSQDM